MNISVTLSENKKVKPRFGEEAFPFAKVTTDHMFLMDYTRAKGWHDARIVPYEPLALDPFTNALHYGQSIFEGMKAYKTKDGGALLFRPYENAKRFNLSAQRMCMPELDPDIMVGSVVKLLEIEKDWIPAVQGMSLYIRPFMFATEPTINVILPDAYLYMVILSPFGSLYGAKPVRIAVETEYIRAGRGGTGAAKCAGNYAGAMLAVVEAKKRGFDQVLWLDGTHRKYIEEVSTMNVFFVIDDLVVTPAVSDSILDGVTRKSVVQILKDWGYTVEERQISIDELAEAHAHGRVKEVFCTGTAAVITSIGEIAWGDKAMVFHNMQIGDLTKRVYDELTGIQTGICPDTRGWTYQL